jgi:hypothetical protein
MKNELFRAIRSADKNQFCEAIVAVVLSIESSASWDGFDQVKSQ